MDAATTQPDQELHERMVTAALQQAGVAEVMRIFRESANRVQPAQTVVQPTRTVANANDLAR